MSSFDSLRTTFSWDEPGLTVIWYFGILYIIALFVATLGLCGLVAMSMTKEAVFASEWVLEDRRFLREEG